MVKSPKKHSALRIAAFGTLAAIGSYFATSKLYSAALNHTLNKYSEAAALYNTYVDTIEEDYARSMCAEETLQLGRFCDRSGNRNSLHPLQNAVAAAVAGKEPHIGYRFQPRYRRPRSAH